MLLGLAARAAFAPFARRIERAAFDPRAAQERALARILDECAGAELGRRFGLDRVRSLDELARLPPTDYESIREASDRVHRDGARGVFGRSPVVAFALSSGTTGAPKRLPVTLALLASFRWVTLAFQACVVDACGEWDHFARGRQLLLSNPGEIERAPSGLPCGYMSGIVLARAPRILRRRYLPSRPVMREPDWTRKLARICDEARGADVRVIGGFPAALKSLVETALDRFRVSSLREIWPNLRAVLFGGSPLGDGARAHLQRALTGGAPLHFWENYSAIESMFGHSFRRDWPGLAFNPLESVFLFGDSPEPARLRRLDELEAGERAFVFVTTLGGLVNWRMNDAVEITSRRPLTFRFAGRAFDQVSISSERITTADADEAFSAAGSGSDFALWLEEGPPARVVWALPSGGDDDAAALDRALCARNVGYARLRQSGFFAESRVERITVERFRAYRARNLHRGTFKEKKIFRDRSAFEREFG